MPQQESGRPNLSPRQAEVIRLVSLGCSEREIGAILGLASATVNILKNAAMMLLGTGKDVLVTRLAIKHRYSSLEDELSAEEKRLSGRENDGWN